MKRTVTKLIDDFTGIEEEDTQTVQFGVPDSQTGVMTVFEIDLGREHRRQFHQALEPYVKRARPVADKPVRAKTNRPRRRDDTAAVRDWARNNGYDIGDRGRIPNDITEAYRAAQSVRTPTTEES